jgi:hypothetical protein
MWLNICAFPHILGSPFSYMTFQPLPSEFPYIYEIFFFINVGTVGYFYMLSRNLWIDIEGHKLHTEKAMATNNCWFYVCDEKSHYFWEKLVSFLVDHCQNQVVADQIELTMKKFGREGM